MNEERRGHFLSGSGAVVCDPVPVTVPVKCRRGSAGMFQGRSSPSCDGIVGSPVNGTAGCQKCGLAHGFMKINGEVRYGAYL